jgi:hypothetical protein
VEPANRLRTTGTSGVSIRMNAKHTAKDSVQRNTTKRCRRVKGCSGCTKYMLSIGWLYCT